MDSFIKYFGGKSKLREKIISMIPKHKTYIESFCGASWLLFSKPESHIEVINDIDNEIVNLYFVIKNQLNEFIDLLNDIPISEKLFNIYAAQKGIPVLDLEQRLTAQKGIPKLAMVTYYNLMNSFNGNISNKLQFSIDKNRRSGFVRFYNTDWNLITNRLNNVTILNRDFKNIFELYDSKDAFFYLDPPYLVATDNNNYYKNTFNEKDHRRLLVYLKDIAGKFILSYSNEDKIKNMYKDFNIFNYKEYPKELLITNYEISDKPYFCREGIPNRARVKRVNWNNSNCPYCDSREIQQVSKRITIEGNIRNWIPCGFICRNCGELFKKT